MIRRRIIACILLIALTSLASGCVSTLSYSRQTTTDLSLPEVRSGPEATVGDRQSPQEHTAILYLPEPDGNSLTPKVQGIVVESGQTKQEAYVVELLRLISESEFNTTNQQLRLSAVSNAVETSRDIATVNLHTSVRYLSSISQFALRMAIINTLTELPETNYVNILVNGRDIGLDILETVPTGVMARNPSNDVANYWSQLQSQLRSETGELQRTVALYFISDDGKYLLGEARNVTFDQQTPQAYALELLDALSKGPRLAGTRTFVPTSNWFERDPELVQEEDSLYIALYLLPQVSDYLRTYGGTPAMMLSSICYTLTGFIPKLDGIITYIDGEPVTELTLMNGEEWIMQNGLMTRESVLTLAADVCTVYYPLASEAGLYAVSRPIAQRLRSQPRALLRELMRPPTLNGLIRALPEEITDADILGLQVHGDTVLINVTSAFAQACKDLNSTQERNLVYAIVNTLTELESIKRVRFFVEGTQTPLAGSLFMSGEFLRHIGLIYTGPME